MSQAKLTTWGLYNYLEYRKVNLFQDMILPDIINKDNAISNILIEAGEFPVIYSDPDFFINAIGVWSRKNYENFKKIAEALNAEFNPLWNVDGTETVITEWGKKHSKTDIGEINGTNQSTSGATTNPTSSTTTGQVSAYDTENWSNSEKATTETGAIVSSGTNQDIVKTEAHSNENTDDAHVDKVTTERHGNIGVTKSTELVADAVELRLAYNIIKIVTDSFIDEFCIPVYV